MHINNIKISKYAQEKKLLSSSHRTQVSENKIQTLIMSLTGTNENLKAPSLEES